MGDLAISVVPLAGATLTEEVFRSELVVGGAVEKVVLWCFLEAAGEGAVLAAGAINPGHSVVEGRRAAEKAESDLVGAGVRKAGGIECGQRV